MATSLTRKRFVQTSAVAGAGIALTDPLSALAARKGRKLKQTKSRGYGPVKPRPEANTGELMLALPPGFAYRVVQRSGDPLADGSPCPGIFDGMAAFRGPRGQTILIRNHENRSQEGEIPVAVRAGKRYDPDPTVRGGCTKLVLDAAGNIVTSFAVLGGTHTNCAGGLTPWGTWITCEEIFNYAAAGSTPGTGVPHGYAFEIPADAAGPVTPQPIVDAGRFSHEAVAWSDGALYLTEDRGDAAFYRFVPGRQPREHGDLADFGGTLQALRVVGRPNFDANLASPGEVLDVQWVTIDEPNPLTDTIRAEAQGKGAAIFDRTEGIWAQGRRLVFDCTSGGEAGLGQLWALLPGDRLRLVYESTSEEDLQAPDNLVLVPRTGDVLLQEDGPDEQFVRGVTNAGAIYDFAHTVANPTEFCGGCFSPDGQTFFLNQQGGRLAPGQDPAAQPFAEAGVTYAITGPFASR